MASRQPDADVVRGAETLAAAIGDGDAFVDVQQRHGREYLRLLEAVRATHQRFAFDREGRPGAVAAVRAALPIVESELFDAVLEDHACELAAVEEALFQVARACARLERSPGSGGNVTPSTTDPASAPTKIHKAT
jgi:hypothetical protein